MSPPRVRRATAPDAARLAEVHINSWRQAYGHIFSEEFLSGLDLTRRTEAFRARIEEGAAILVSEDGDGAIVGFCHVGPARAEEGWGELYAIYVDPHGWGQGHGQALIEEGEKTLSGMGFDHALLWVLEDNPRARAFYQRQRWTLGERSVVEEIGGVTVTEVIYQKEPLTGA